MKNRSILWQISRSAAAAVLLFLGLWTAGMVVWLYSWSLIGLEREADRQAKEVAAALGPLVWNLDDRSVLTYLETKTENPEIVSIEVTEVVGGFHWKAPAVPPRVTFPVGTTRTVPVRYEGKTIGSARLQMSLGPRNSQTTDSVLSLIISQILLFLALLASVALSWRGVSRRLRAMVKVVDEFSINPGPVRMEAAKDDELGILARGFNIMADRIQATTSSMEQEIRERTERLMESEKMALVGSLVAGVAHEINTPVGNGITISSWLATRTREIRGILDGGKIGDEDLALYLTDVESSLTILLSGLDRTSNLIQSFKKIGADQVVDERRSLPVTAFIQEVVSSLRPSLKHFPHEIQVESPEDLTIESHPGALFQIVTNLILNAHHHAFRPEQPGIIYLTVRDHLGDPSRFELEVRDDGIGMAPEVQSQIFEPFFTTSRQEGGTGLGLSIVDTLVRNLGGTISVRSAPNRGATFTAVLPKKAPDR